MMSRSMHSAFISVLLVLSFCTPSISQETAKLSCPCPKILKPVCCKFRTGVTKIVSNSCLCTCVNQGKVVPLKNCRIITPPPICKCALPNLGVSDSSSRPIPLPKPVCCLLPNGRTVRLFSSCQCRCRRGRVIPYQKCMKPKITPTPTPSTSPRPSLCICPLIFAPVCCKLPSGKLVTKGNSCECNCAKGSVTKQGGCSVPGGCICPAVFQPVCCKLPSGKSETRSNGCQCGCDNGTVTSHGPCPSPPVLCRCANIEKPVCCLRDGKIETQGNACLCGCGGGHIISEGACKKPCACPKILKPVQCLIGKKIIMRDNDCLCKCIGGIVVGGIKPIKS